MENITDMDEGTRHEIDLIYYAAIEEVHRACEAAMDKIDRMLFGNDYATKLLGVEVDSN